MDEDVEELVVVVFEVEVEGVVDAIVVMVVGVVLVVPLVVVELFEVVDEVVVEEVVVELLSSSWFLLARFPRAGCTPWTKASAPAAEAAAGL